MPTIRIKNRQDFTALLEKIPAQQNAYIAAATERQAELTKPPGSLGRLEDIAVFFAGWQGTVQPSVDPAACLVFAGNHGVTARGVSAFPPEVTAQMVANFSAGGAAINQLCDVAGAELSVIPLDLNKPVADFTVGHAMTEAECCEAIQAGIDAVPDKAGVLLLGEMGIGNTTSAAAVAYATFGGDAESWIGHGTGVDEDGLKAKLQVIKDARKLHSAHQRTAFDVLCTVGGRELAAIAGATLAARLKSIPVLLDGFISTAAAASLIKLNPHALDHCLISHLSAEPGHKRIADQISKKPLLDLGMRLGEASGAAVALMVVRSALAAHNGMATFAEAGVSNSE